MLATILTLATLLSGPAGPTSAEVPATAEAAAPAGVLVIEFFKSPGCLKCQRVERFLPDVEARWGDRIQVRRYDTQDDSALLLWMARQDQTGSTQGSPPAVYLAGRMLGGDQEIIDRLDAAIREALDRIAAGGAVGPASAPAPGSLTDRAMARLRSFKWVAVMLSGLVDGVNPCAFTTIVFLISMLSYLGRGRRQIGIVGVAFTLAVFVTYFLIGLGLFGAIRQFAEKHGVMAGLSWVVAVLAFALAAWSLYDGVRIIRTGKVPDNALGMPASVRNRIHAVIRTGLKTPHLALGAFAVGCLVSVLESVCTGQVYLPILMYIARDPDSRPYAIPYLLLYNVAFIVPLAIVMGLAYWGVSSQRLGEFVKAHLATVKFLLAGLFAALGALLVATL